jgi:hypothetical protein
MFIPTKITSKSFLKRPIALIVFAVRVLLYSKPPALQVVQKNNNPNPPAETAGLIKKISF